MRSGEEQEYAKPHHQERWKPEECIEAGEEPVVQGLTSPVQLIVQVGTLERSKGHGAMKVWYEKTASAHILRRFSIHCFIGDS